MHFDEWDARSGERVANGETGVRVRAGVHECAVDFSAQRMDRVHDVTLAVVLAERQRHPELTRDGLEIFLDVIESLFSIKRRLANPKQVEIRSVDDGDFHYEERPSSQVRNLATSSSDSFPGDAEGARSPEG